MEFLKRILQDDYYYDYVRRFVNNDISYFCVSYIIGGYTGGTINYQKSQIIKGIEQLISSNRFVLQQEEKKEA